jgi:hypothetical protein
MMQSLRYTLNDLVDEVDVEFILGEIVTLKVDFVIEIRCHRFVRLPFPNLPLSVHLWFVFGLEPLTSQSILVILPVVEGKSALSIDTSERLTSFLSKHKRNGSE